LDYTFWATVCKTVCGSTSPYAIRPLSVLSVTLVYCGQTTGWIKIKLGLRVGLGPGHIVLNGDPAPPSKKGGRVPHFWPMSIVAKRLDGSRWHLARRWPRSRPHCARWGFSSPPKKGAPPIFGPFLLWPNGWIDQDDTWHGGRLRPGPHCARWGPSSPPQKKRGGSPCPIFGPCLLWSHR